MQVTPFFAFKSCYYQTFFYILLNLDLNECSINDDEGRPGGCQNEAPCIDSADSDDDDLTIGYKCDCLDGWDGEHCENGE